MTKDEWIEAFDTMSEYQLEEEKGFLIEEISADECVVRTSDCEAFHKERLDENRVKLEAVDELLGEL